MRRTTKFLFAAAALSLSGMGCELIATVDRSQIPASAGGAGGEGGTGGAASSSSSGMGGTAGMGGGGMGGTGGTAGMGGTGGTAGMGGMGGGMGGSAGMGGMGGSAGMGGGGMGGAAGMGGMGGTGGMPQCTMDAQCDDQNACTTDTCNGGQCTNVNLDGVTTPGYTDAPGDCVTHQCVNGVDTMVDADTETPDDANDCTTDSCMNGAAMHTNVMQGMACGMNNNLVCDGMGNCVGCNAPADCDGQDTTCQTRTCIGGTCGFDNAILGTPVNDPTPGDCQQNVCDGNGNVITGAKNSDTPNDNNTCTTDTCASGTPTFTPVTAGTACSQNGGSVCSAAGACVQCIVASTCPGTDTTCQTRTCISNTCGFSNAGLGTPVNDPTPGDCQQVVCDGNGNTTTGANNTDTPNDNNTCTTDACSSGAPTFTPVMTGTACNQNGGSFCSAAGSCVQCITASDCPGMDSACQVRTCNAGMCGTQNVAAGTFVDNGTVGDCQQNQCDGNGNITTGPNNNDFPNDNNECTADTCNNGAPVSTPTAPGSACTAGGAVCNGAGTCVDCVAPTDCPGTDTECSVRTCTTNLCGVFFTPADTPVASQTPGDCKLNACDGVGNVGQINDNADLPVDANQCTDNVCTSGVPSNPNSASGTACNQNGGTQCDGMGMCIVPVTPPTVVSTTPADAATNVDVGASIVVNFSAAMNPASLTAQTTTGPCTGSIQLSTDNFSSCVGFAAAAPSMNAGNDVATLVPAPGLSYGTTYKIRVTTGATSSLGAPLASAYTSMTGFSTSANAGACSAGVVISQVYGGGGNASATYTNDFIELHNNGSTTVDISGWSVQYQTQGGTTWASTVIPAGKSIAPGGYFLIQQAGGATGGPLPMADATGTINVNSTQGKVALVANSTTLGTQCPMGSMVDLVQWGTASQPCFEGATFATAPVGNAQSLHRKGLGCTDTNQNASDFAAGVVTPRNVGSTASACSCTLNEGNAALEADYCNIQFPTSLSVQTGTTTALVYGRVFENAVTPPAGASSWVAQLGYGPEGVNPQWQSGWTWFPASFNAQFGNDDEYQSSFTAPAPGSYRYGYRFSSDGVNWTYCDLNGAGSNGGLSFEVNQLPVLTVTP